MAPILVMPMYRPTLPAGTTLWASEEVAAWLRGIKDTVQRRQFMYRFQRFCDANFRQHMPDTIKRELGKTYCIHMGHFRVVGFFDGSYEDFIALAVFEKKTQKNTGRMNSVYAKVEEIREAKSWIKEK